MCRRLRARLVNRTTASATYRCGVPSCPSPRAAGVCAESPVRATRSAGAQQAVAPGVLDRAAFLQALGAALCADRRDAAAQGGRGPSGGRRDAGAVLCWRWQGAAAQEKRPPPSHLALAAVVLRTWADQVSGALASRWSCSAIALYVPVSDEAEPTRQAVQGMLDAATVVLAGQGAWVAQRAVEMQRVTSGDEFALSCELGRLQQALR